MSQVQKIYADGLFQLYMANGMVHLSCGNIPYRGANDEEQSEIPTEISCKIAMTPLGFAESFERMERMMEVLLEKGILRRRDAEDVEAAE